jgi:uncharacterized protein (TIGR02996 family)
MSDEAALLAAIIAHPDEDTPRLMYADWLTEHGQPERAEFIRLQCAVAADEAAEERVLELEERNRGKWLLGLPQFSGARWAFRRGLPEHLDVATEPFMERYRRFVAVPSLRSLCLQTFAWNAAVDFASSEWNPQWVELELRAAGYTDLSRTVATVAANPQIRQLRALRFAAFDLSPACVRILAESPHLDGLRHLGVPGDRNRPLFAPLRERFGDRLVDEGQWR